MPLDNRTARIAPHMAHFRVLQVYYIKIIKILVGPLNVFGFTSKKLKSSVGHLKFLWDYFTFRESFKWAVPRMKNAILGTVESYETGM